MHVKSMSRCSCVVVAPTYSGGIVPRTVCTFPARAEGANSSSCIERLGAMNEANSVVVNRQEKDQPQVVTGFDATGGSLKFVGDSGGVCRVTGTDWTVNPETLWLCAQVISLGALGCGVGGFYAFVLGLVRLTGSPVLTVPLCTIFASIPRRPSSSSCRPGRISSNREQGEHGLKTSTITSLPIVIS